VLANYIGVCIFNWFSVVGFALFGQLLRGAVGYLLLGAVVFCGLQGVCIAVN